jgi:hypothetical protein
LPHVYLAHHTSGTADPLLSPYPRSGAMRAAWRGDSRGIGVWLCRILDMNFGEFSFHALR